VRRKRTLRGKGEASTGGGGAADALIEMTVRPQRFFKRDGDDIRLDLPIIISRMNRNQRQRYPSAVRANLDGPPIHICPIVPASAGAKEKNHVGSGH
jgi:hypothetical protein